ncbi:preprotein translocase subunit YajC [Fulvitalea axinellae]|uniref:Sec translocon accessory complex subunit YajC n=1 Tax=Fulvitalea axinellae TaxID=1182444 RepID=A0AAU9CED3_9BACT|nr:preprotein translocase subunit YajC [Fulvitalea axinellae]
MNFETILAQAAPAQGNPWQSWVMIGLIFVVFYFFMIRPQQKRQKEHKKLIDAIKKGDEIVTAGGIHGKIVSLGDNDITIDIDGRGTKMTIDRSSVSRVKGEEKK